MPGQGISVVTPDNGLQIPGLDLAAAAAMQGQMPDPAAVAKQKEDDPMSDKKLVEAFQDFKEEADDQRWVFEREWWRNLLYYVSRQWIYYDTRRSAWLDKRMARWVPRPVTNKIQETTDGMMSVAQSVQLGIVCRPEGADPIDLMTAESATRMAPALHVEHQMENGQQTADFWSLVTGNSFLQLWWDRSGEKGKIVVPLEKCAACNETHRPDQIVAAGNVCPSCGSPSLNMAIDETTGKPLIERFARGRGRTDVLSPFEVGFKLSFTNFNEIDGLYRKRWRTKGWCKKNLPKTIFDKLQWERMSSDRSLQLLRGIQTQSDLATPSFGEGGGGQSSGDGITEYDWWMKPSAEYPEGLVCRFMGEANPIVVRLENEGLPGPLPYKTPQGDPFFPFVHLPFKRMAGRIWGISPLNVLIQKQDQLNQLDSMIQMMVLRTSNPVWIEPKGSAVTKRTGEPGIVLTYTPLLGQNAKPERIAGEQVPASLFQIRRDLIADIESLAGTFDIIKGQKPTGVEAFSALQLLVERSQSRFGPWLAQRGEAYKEWFSMAIELERQFGPDERAWAVLGPNNQWTFEEFRRADLQGAIRIVVEDGSQTPKTSLGKRAAIQQLSQLGVIDAANPDTAYRILQAFGETDLWPGLDSAVQSALREQYNFEKWAETVEIGMSMPEPVIDPLTGAAVGVNHVPQFSAPPPGQRMVWDNDAIHIEEHKKWANSDTVRRLIEAKPWLADFIAWMIQQHEQALAWKQMMEAGGVPGGVAGVETPENQAMLASNRESGNPGDVPSGQSESAQGRGPE